MAPSLPLLMRAGILRISQQPTVVRSVRKYGMRLGARRFVAGETLDECVHVLRRLNSAGFQTNTTLLGESVKDVATAQSIAREYLGVLDRLAEERLRTNLSVKLTHLGLIVDEESAYSNVGRLVDHAASNKQFVRIDMEESAFVSSTLRIYRRLRETGRQNVGTVLQAYLRRSERDLLELLPLKPNLRLVKGAYLESPSVAFPRKRDVDRNLFKLISTMLTNDAYTAIATHDEALIERATEFISAHGVPFERFEFQMLYGIRNQLQLELLKRGYRVLIATPYGEDWYPYLIRRMAERPANVFFIVRNLLK